MGASEEEPVVVFANSSPEKQEKNAERGPERCVSDMLKLLPASLLCLPGELGAARFVFHLEFFRFHYFN